ncbi:MAG: type II toxin-antitoxin system mRNA interferase toxin, RelE/StbE family [Cellvibrionales bacterium]|nr:MAG: type II toxin-antitoxin system mRNA interferase toxin, RelE/StbE family [Cellvibrionales bacterium]
MQLRWAELADADLESIEAHISEVNSPTTAIDVVLNIIDSVQLILPEHPGAGRQGRVKNTRELVVDGLQFIVIYREQLSEGRIEILRVLHGAQQWPKAN